MAGHWSRLATAPEIAQVRMTGSSTGMDTLEVGRVTSHFGAVRMPTQLAGYPQGDPTPPERTPHMIGEIIAAIVIGIIAGYLGRALLPGDDSMGFVATVAVGIVGALVGYFLFTAVLGIGDSDKFDLGGIVGAIIGTMIVLLVVRMFHSRGRASGGPASA